MAKTRKATSPKGGKTSTLERRGSKPATSERPAGKRVRAPKPAMEVGPADVEAVLEAAAKVPPAEAPLPRPAPAPDGSASAPGEISRLSEAQRTAFESLSANLARAAVAAQGAIAGIALRQAEHPAALNADPFHVGPAMSEVMGSMAAQPEKLMRLQSDLFGRYLDLWRFASMRAMGEETQPAAAPAKGDKRFTDPDWSTNPMFDVIKQSYLITADWMRQFVAAAEGVDPLNKRRVEFFTQALADAFSPSNYLLTNPAALRAAIETRGESIAKGMENFAADLERGGGQLAISQTDFRPFKVGENVATAPGKVIFQNELIQLLQFSPSTERVFDTPLLIFPPWINKYYILDLRVENSMIRWLTSQGLTVFVTSWVNPDGRLANKTFEDYLDEGFYAALDKVIEQTGVKAVNTVGYCIGGTLLSCALAHMAARKDKRVASATFFAAQQDFSEAGDLLIFANDGWLGELEQRMDAGGGVLAGQTMADTFNSLRANDLIWSFFVSNYLMGKEPKPFDLLFWNSDQTRMPKTLHLSYLRTCYRDNALAKGEMQLAGQRLDLGKVTIPIFVQSSKEDHIAPARSVYKGARLFGGPTKFTLAGSGHIAGVINAPAALKYQHWTNDALPPTLDEWMAGAVEHPGSWWPHWVAWLAERSGGKVPARDPAKGQLKPLEDAPGSFVKVRS